MEKKEKVIVYNDNDRAIVGALKGTDGMTLAELSAATGLELKPGNIRGSINKGLVEVIGEKDIERDALRNVSTYSLITAEVMTNGEGDKAKPYSYSETETAILNALNGAEAPMTLAEISTKVGKTLVSGNINGLVTKGNVRNDGKIKVSVKVPDTVKVYGFLADIPTEA